VLVISKLYRKFCLKQKIDVKVYVSVSAFFRYDLKKVQKIIFYLDPCCSDALPDACSNVAFRATLPVNRIIHSYPAV